MKMDSDEKRSSRDGSARMKKCRRCEYNGKVNQDRICGSCEEIVKSGKEVCTACDCWV